MTQPLEEPSPWKVKQTERKRRRMAAWLSGEGIEIGALHRPLEPPSGVHVRYVDRFPESELRRHYPELAAHAFAPVSLVGDAYDLRVVADASIDFVIANHLVEHLEFPIRAFTEFHRVLKPGGVAYMALPDARLGIDHDRGLTSLDHLIEEHRAGGAKTRERHYLEWVTESEKIHEDVGNRVRRLMEMDYSIHFHVFLPDTFLAYLYWAKRETGLDLSLAGFAPPEFHGDDEFIVVLLKGEDRHIFLPPQSQLSRKTLRQSLAASPAGPALRPAYRLGRRLLAAAKRRTPPGDRS